jgi:4-nitrophenyl phosphatase
MGKLQNYKGIVFDMDGVLRIGNSPIKGSNKLFSRLSGKALIVTNECRRTPQMIKDELSNMGIEIGDTPILTSGIMTFNYLNDIIGQDKNQNTIFNVMTVGEEGLLEVLEELSFLNNYRKITPIFIETALRKNKRFMDNAKYVNYLVIGSINNLSLSLIDQINNYFKVFSNIKVLITCPDKLDPEGCKVIVPNHLIHILNYNKEEIISPYYIGKPNPIVTKYIEKYFDDKKDRNNAEEDIIFVGDTLDTDIKLANEAFFKSILVLSGNTCTKDLKKSQIVPDYTIDSVDNLFSVIC